MDRYESSFCGQLMRTDGATHTPAEIETYIDLVVAELEQLGAQDIDVSTNLETGLVEASISLESPDLMDAQQAGSGAIRSAFHAAEIATPGWAIDWVGSSMQRDGDLVDA